MLRLGVVRPHRDINGNIVVRDSEFGAFPCGFVRVRKSLHKLTLTRSAAPNLVVQAPIDGRTPGCAERGAVRTEDRAPLATACGRRVRLRFISRTRWLRGG